MRPIREESLRGGDIVTVADRREKAARSDWFRSFVRIHASEVEGEQEAHKTGRAVYWRYTGRAALGGVAAQPSTIGRYADHIDSPVAEEPKSRPDRGDRRQLESRDDRTDK